MWCLYQLQVVFAIYESRKHKLAATGSELTVSLWSLHPGPVGHWGGSAVTAEVSLARKKKKKHYQQRSVKFWSSRDCFLPWHNYSEGNWMMSPEQQRPHRKVRDMATHCGQSHYITKVKLKACRPILGHHIISANTYCIFRVEGSLLSSPWCIHFVGKPYWFKSTKGLHSDCCFYII